MGTGRARTGLVTVRVVGCVLSPGALRVEMVAAALRCTAEAVTDVSRLQVLACLDDVVALLELDTKVTRRAADELVRSVRLIAPREHTKLLVDVSNACLLPAEAGGSSFVALAKRLVEERLTTSPEVMLVAQLPTDRHTPDRIGEILEVCAVLGRP